MTICYTLLVQGCTHLIVCPENDYVVCVCTCSMEFWDTYLLFPWNVQFIVRSSVYVCVRVHVKVNQKHARIRIIEHYSNYSAFCWEFRRSFLTRVLNIFAYVCVCESVCGNYIFAQVLYSKNLSDLYPSFFTVGASLIFITSFFRLAKRKQLQYLTFVCTAHMPCHIYTFYPIFHRKG